MIPCSLTFTISPKYFVVFVFFWLDAPFYYSCNCNWGFFLNLLEFLNSLESAFLLSLDLYFCSNNALLC